MSEKTEASNSNNRWWESYLVRYFLGFIIGSICVFIIAKFAGIIPNSITLLDNTSKAVENESKYGITSIVIAIALLGLAYCYVASTPITVLHAGRYIKGRADRLSRFFWLGWVGILGISMVLPKLVIYTFPCAKEIYIVSFLASIIGIVYAATRRFKKNAPDHKSTPKDGVQNTRGGGH